MIDFSFLNPFLSPYNIDEKWYPYIIIGAFLLVLLIVYIIFMYIRSFVSWINGNSELISLQEETNSLLQNILNIQNEQLTLLEAIYFEDSEETEDEITENAIEINKEENSEETTKEKTCDCKKEKTEK